MRQLRYVEIENFKTFGDKIHVDLSHPAVLIGPNNAGKTSIIQALALWNRGIRAWFDKKGQPRIKDKRERISAGINRLHILEIPVAETRFFWSHTRVRRGNIPIKMTINVGLEYKGEVSDCRLEFTQRDSELIYCRPCPDTVEREDLLAFAATLQFHLLYPMSGIETDEPLVQEGRINVLMGQGQTAQVLRNLCYKIRETDTEHGTSDWGSIADLMKTLFSIDLRKPELNAQRGNLILKYHQEGIDHDLDISLAGRGLQQILLVLAYLYSHKRSILMIDEPDAHLEILRQKQVYEILKDVAQENQCQVVIATHSEVILDDAVESNLTLLINGKAVNLANRIDIRHSLRTFGMDHYYKAKVLPRILYIEGSTDLANLKSLAKKFNHKAYEILSGKLNYYYIRDSEPESSLTKSLEKLGGKYMDYKQHFHTLKHFIEEFKGIAIFDGDGREVRDSIDSNLAVVYWKNYELENYFISPELILKFVESLYEREASLFKSLAYGKMKEIIDKRLLVDVFSNDKSQLEEFHRSSKNLRRTLLRNLKMSKFADQVFEEFARSQNRPVLLKKAEYHRLIEFIDIEDIPVEVNEKLDLIVEYLHWKEN